jgi:hypothetical protein
MKQISEVGGPPLAGRDAGVAPRACRLMLASMHGAAAGWHLWRRRWRTLPGRQPKGLKAGRHHPIPTQTRASWCWLLAQPSEPPARACCCCCCRCGAPCARCTWRLWQQGQAGRRAGRRARVQRHPSGLLLGALPGHAARQWHRLAAAVCLARSGHRTCCTGAARPWRAAQALACGPSLGVRPSPAAAVAGGVSPPCRLARQHS